MSIFVNLMQGIFNNGMKINSDSIFKYLSDKSSIIYKFNSILSLIIQIKTSFKQKNLNQISVLLMRKYKIILKIKFQKNSKVKGNKINYNKI